ncbi:MAG TPA: DinB family protein, partial [Chloroflexota bacterium]
MDAACRAAAFGDLELELKHTRRVLERLPAHAWNWTPHAKSWSLGTLAAHLVQLLAWGEAALRAPEVDLAQADSPPLPRNPEELLAQWDRRADALRAAWSDLGDGALADTWTLRRGDQVLLRLPRAAILRTFVLSHLIHHRAQLVVY